MGKIGDKDNGLARTATSYANKAIYAKKPGTQDNDTLTKGATMGYEPAKGDTSTSTVAALERESDSAASNPAASSNVTKRQAVISSNLTNPDVSFDELSADDRRLARQAAEGEKAAEDKRMAAAAEGRTVPLDGEYVDPNDVHLLNQANKAETDQIAQETEDANPRPPLEVATKLSQELTDSKVPHTALDEQVPGILESLKDADPAVVSQTMAQFSQIAHDNPQLVDALARHFGENPPHNLSATLEGLAGSSAAGRPELSGAIATLLETQQNPTASQFRSVANLADAVGDIKTALEPKSLLGAGQAADRISEAIKDAPPEVAQALLNQLGVDGSLASITGVLDQSANGEGLDGDLATLGDDGFHINDPLAPLGPEGKSNLETFDRVVGSLSQAVTAADDSDVTELVSGHVANAIGESDIRRFDESFALTIAGGGGAGLAGGVATELKARGRQAMAEKVADSAGTGFTLFEQSFDFTADKVDLANNDLNYLLTQWGPFYGDDEAGQAALNQQVQAFRDSHPEYSQLEKISGSAGGDLEVLRDLQADFPEKGYLRERELALLREVPRFGQTEAGRRELGEAAARRGTGEETFLDRLDDQDFLDSLPEDYYQNLGYQDQASFQAGMSQQLLNGSLSLMAESAAMGDMRNVDQISEGLLEYHQFLGEDREALADVLDANQELMANSANLTKEGAGAWSEALNASAERLATTTAHLTNPASVNRLRAGGALAALGAGGLSWWAGARGGPEVSDALSATTDTLEGLLAAGGAANKISSGAVLAQFTDNFVSTGGKFFGAAGALLDTYSLVQAVEKGDWAQAGISTVSVAGGIAAALGATGVGLALGIGAAVLGLGYAQYQKVKASNRFETPQTEAFIRGALEQSGALNGQLDGAIYHLRNADDEGRNVGVLVAQAAEARGMEPIDLLRAIAQQDPDRVLDIVETGHAIDPQSDDLTDLKQSGPLDSQVGDKLNNSTWHNTPVVRPSTVEGFAVYLQKLGVI